MSVKVAQQIVMVTDCTASMTGNVPAEISLCRKTRTVPKLLRPAEGSADDIVRDRQKENFDKRTKNRHFVMANW